MKHFHDVAASSFTQHADQTGTNTLVGPLSVGGISTLTGAVTAPAGITGPTEGTHTGAVVGNVTGNASGTALTVTQAAQVAITSLGTLTTLQVDTTNINGSEITRTAAAAEHGAGVIGTGTQTAPITTRWIEDGVIVTQIKFDLTGLGVVGTAANDVIGLVAGGVAFLGRNVVATNGIIFKAHMFCIEAAAGSATITQDIDIATNASGTLEYDGAAGAGKLINGATMVAGQGVENLVPATTANDYYYIVEADTAATTGVYSAGQYVLTTWGYPLLT